MRDPFAIDQHLRECDPSRRDRCARDGDKDGLPVVGLMHNDKRNHARGVVLLLALINLDWELRNNGGHVGFLPWSLWTMVCISLGRHT